MTPAVRKISGFFLVLALFTATGWFLYAPAMRAPFVFDDIDNIVNNPSVRLTEFTPETLTGLLKNQIGKRPLAYASFAVNYYFGRFDAWGYHAVNVIIHIITTLLVLMFARQTFDLCGIRNKWISILTALVWLVNPVHSQSVTYTVQRMNSLATLLYLLALICFIQARRKARAGNESRPLQMFLYAGCLISALLGLASKPIVATLPVVLLVYEWFFFRNLSRTWLKKCLLWTGLVILTIIGLGLLYTSGAPLEDFQTRYGKQSFTLVQRLLTQPQVVLYYLTLLLFPHPSRLNLDYSFPVALSPCHPATTLPAVLALTALVVMAVYMARKDRLFSFAIIWFLVTLSIESSFIGLALIFEHRTYLPSVFPVIAVTSVIVRRIKPSLVGILIVMATAVIWGYGTYQRNRVWADELRFWADAAAKTPRSPRVLNNLGMAYRQNGRMAAAEKAFREALSYNPETKDALNNLGTILLNKGEIPEALDLFDHAIAIEPGFYDAHYNRGLALMKLGQIVDAARAFQETIRLNPFSEKAHGNLGAALMRQFDIDKAIFHFHRALELDPSFIEAYNNMGIAYFKKGLPDQAFGWFNKALDIDPFYIEAYDNLKRIRFLSGEHAKEISRLRQNLSRQPGNPSLHFRLAELYEKSGMTALARDYYEKTLALQPNSVESLNNLGNLYAAHYQDTQALAMFRRLATILPESPKIHYNLACLYARQGRPDEALRHLETALEKGYDNWHQIKVDKDLENIRQTKYFKMNISDLRANEKQ